MSERENRPGDGPAPRPSARRDESSARAPGLVGAVAVLATLGGVVLWLSMLAAPWRLATGLNGAATHLRRVDQQVSGGRLKKAELEALLGRAAADRAVAGLGSHTALLDLARLVEPAGDVLSEAPHLVSAARHSARAATGTLDVARGALRGPEPVFVNDPSGDARVSIDRVREIGALLSGVKSDVAAVRDQLRAVDPRNLPRRLRPDISRGIRDARATEAILGDAKAGFEILPGVLGDRGPRTYLIGMQNPAELRGTGGSFLRFALFSLDAGRAHLEPSKTVYRVDRNRRRISIPLPKDAWYVRSIEDAQRFGNANWSPDWPLSARLTVDYGRARNKELGTIDGVIGVDPIVMQELVPGVGPFRTEGGRPVTAKKVVPFVLHKAYGTFPNPGVRRSVLQQMIDAFYDRLIRPKHPTGLVQAFGKVLAQKHMQIWLTRTPEQDYIERVNWDGAIEDEKKADYLYVVEQNVGGNKLDYFQDQTHTIDVDVSGDDALVSTAVEIFNSVVLPQPRYATGDSHGFHRPMINVYVSRDARLRGWKVEPPRLDQPEPAVWRNQRPPEHHERGKKVWSATLEVPPRRSRALRFSYRVPGAVRTVQGRNVYRLMIQRQPKVRPETLIVRFHLPDGAQAVRTSGFERNGDVVVWRRPLIKDTVLEVSWRS